MLDKNLQALYQDYCRLARETGFLFDSLAQFVQTEDPAIATEIVSGETEAEKLKKRIDRTCHVVLILREPYGLEFRRVIAILKSAESFIRIVQEIESIFYFKKNGCRTLDRRILQAILETSMQLHEMIHLAVHEESVQGDHLIARSYSWIHNFFDTPMIEALRPHEALQLQSLKNIHSEIACILENQAFEKMEGFKKGAPEDGDQAGIQNSLFQEGMNRKNAI